MTEAPEPKASIFLEQDMEAGEVMPFAGGRAGVFSSCKPGADRPNEDSGILLEFGSGSGVLAVADGAGGQAAGGKASALAIRTLESTLRRAGEEGESFRSPILNAMERANARILELGVGAAATMALAEIRGNRVRPYHAGDSLILIVGNRGKQKHLSVPHSPVGYAVEAELLDQKEAMHHEDRHLVSNFLGSQEMKIELGPTLELSPRDSLLLATDGLFDNLHLEEIIETIRGGPLEKAVASLAATARKRMQGNAGKQPSKPDDLTFILFRPEG